MIARRFRTLLDVLHIRSVSSFNPHINEENLLDVLVEGGGVGSSSMYASALNVRQFRFLCLKTVAYPATVCICRRFPLPATIQEGARNEGMSGPYTESQFINLPAVEVISKG